MRTHLINKLNEGLQREGAGFNRKLTLVSAPAGFGKTTLVCSWLLLLDRPAAWLSLDEGDNEPSRFISYMISALQQASKEVGKTAASLLQSPQPPPQDTLLTLLINDLTALPNQIILVLDDYHVIQNLEIHKAITFLLSNQPSQLHLVIVGREDPALPLHRLRGSGQMTGIHVQDLRFTVDEATQFLNEIMGLSLTTEAIVTLERRTEGWVAGLQLAALSMQDLPDTHEFVTSFAGDDRYITDYLLGEVIERQSPQVREFLSKTAIFDRFCASLCDAVLGPDASVEENSSQTIIEQLDQSNLFITPLDNKREWYRYHHLFADFLRIRLRDQPGSEINDLHRRAAAWYAQYGFIDEAIHHYLAAKDFAQAADLIEPMGTQLITQGQQRKMLDWLTMLPGEFIRTRPLLCVCHAWALNVTGQAAASEPLLQQAESVLATIKPEQARHIRGLIAMIRSYHARRQGNLPVSIQLLRQASADLSPNDLIVNSTVNLNLGFNYLIIGQLARAEQVLKVARLDGQAVQAVYVALIAMALQANGCVAQGKLRQAIEFYEEAIAYGLAHNRNQPFPPAGYAYAGLGQVMYERNELNTAEQLLTQAVQLGESIADWSMVRRGLLPLAWLKQVAGDAGAAQTLWQKALDVVHQAESERVEAQTRAQWARLQLKQAGSDSSAMKAAAKWAETYRDRQPDASSYQEALPLMILAQVELAQGQLNQAIARLNRLAETATDGGHNDNLIKIWLLQSLAYDAEGDRPAALEKLARALALAAPEGYVRTFVDHGLPMQRLLEEATSRGAVSDYVARLLSAFPATTDGVMSCTEEISAVGHPPVIQSLKPQEVRILRLMAVGLSNREIADELYLSVNTIKVYASRIYGKLGVHRRGEAVARAQELGLI